MAYTKTTDFAAKDALISGDPAKVVKGTEIGAEFDAIQTADGLNLKRDGTSTASASIPMGGNKLTGLGAGTTAGDSVRYEQFASPPAIGNTMANTLRGTTVTATTQFSGPGTGLTGTAASLTAGTATVAVNGVVTTGSYSNPAWITALAGAKITGTVASATSATTASVLSSVAAGTNYKSVPGYYGVLQNTSSASYIEVANTLILRNGTYRISLACSFVAGNPTTYVRIYKNGVAFGTETTFNNSVTDGTVIYTEDLSFSEGDTVQLFIKNAVSTASVKLFKFGTASGGVATMSYLTLGDR